MDTEAKKTKQQHENLVQQKDNEIERQKKEIKKFTDEKAARNYQELQKELDAKKK